MSTFPVVNPSSPVMDKEARVQTTHGVDSSPPYPAKLPSWKTRVKNRVLNTAEKYWLFELFGLTLALAALMGTVGLLSIYDGAPSPTWTLRVHVRNYRKSYGLTINTILSIFATVFNSGVLIPVAASLSQLKWIWFQKAGRPLSHYQTFDSAARGPLGSVMLLWALRGRRLACVGALIVIAALGIGFSFQALVVYPLVPIQVDVAHIQRANNYTENSINPFLSNNMLGAIYSGIYRYDSSPVMNASCSSGNCTWPETYTSLAICGQCFNVTASLNASCGTTLVPGAEGNNNPITPLPYCNYTLPNGLKMSGLSGSQYASLEMSSSTANSDHFDESTAITVLSLIQASWLSSGGVYPNLDLNAVNMSIVDVQATQCGLTYCVQKYNTTMSRGVLSEKVVDTYTQGGFDDLGYSLRPPPSFTNQSDANDVNLYQTNSLLALSTFFKEQWQGRYAVDTSFGDANWTSQTALFLYNVYDFDSFGQLFTSLAKSMTNGLRFASWMANDEPFQMAAGRTFQDRPKVQVRWAWIALPATLTGLAAILLVGTILTTRKEHVLPWKGSSLAAFAHPLTSDVRAVVSDVNSPRQVSNIAENLDVKWEKTDRGFRLVMPGEPGHDEHEGRHP